VTNHLFNEPGQTGSRTLAWNELQTKWNAFLSNCFLCMDKQTFASLPQPIALVVDDEPLIRMNTADIVAEAGYHVIEASSADEAYEFLKMHSSLKLLFTDIQMPGDMDGLALARHVGEHWPHIGVVVASGAVMPPLGALPDTARFLSKPLNERLVLDTLEELCPLS
jgi:two-component system, response regulator PdtaR